ncbi:MAG: pyrroline-5-carboxylate reductase [Tissierellia bacterium]|nr:pyrroline-5-carboxylate reductase [Tissierellia bacterium]
MKKIGFIGCGNMGEAMLSGALNSGFVKSDDVVVHTRSRESLERLNKKYGIHMAKDNKDVAEKARIIVLAVKPNIYSQVIEEIMDKVNKDSIILAIAPSFSINVIKSMFNKDIKVVRAMPNTPAMIGCGITGICFSDNMTAEEKKEILEFFLSLGETIEVKEELMKAVGSVSGSSPAFIYMLIEAMADAAVLLGMPRKDAYIFAAKAVEGAARMVVESGKHPGELKDAVCSPGGTTIEGVVKLEEKGFRSSIIEAMIKSAEKFHKMEATSTSEPK